MYVEVEGKAMSNFGLKRRRGECIDLWMFLCGGRMEKASDGLFSLATYSSAVFVELDVVVEEDVFFLDRFAREHHRAIPPATTGETHDGWRRLDKDGWCEERKDGLVLW